MIGFNGSLMDFTVTKRQKKIASIAGFVLYGPLLASSLYLAGRDFVKAANEQPEPPRFSEIADDYINDPAFFSAGCEILAVRQIARDAKGATTPQKHLTDSEINQGHLLAYIQYKKIEELFKQGKPAFYETITALKLIQEVGGFKNAGIDAKRFWSYAKPGAARFAESKYLEAKAMKEADEWNGNQIMSAREAIELAGGYEETAVSPQMLRSALIRTWKETAYDCFMSAKSAIKRAYQVSKLLKHNIKASMAGAKGFIFSGFSLSGFARGRADYMKEQAVEQLLELSSQDSEQRHPLLPPDPKDTVLLDAFILSVGGLDKTGISERTYSKSVGRPYFEGFHRTAIPSADQMTRLHAARNCTTGYRSANLARRAERRWG